MRAFHFVLTLLTLFSVASVESNLTNDPIPGFQPPAAIFAKQPLTKCQMLKESCDIVLLIRSDLNTYDLVLESNAIDVFVYKSIEPCTAGSNLVQCSRQLNVSDFKDAPVHFNYTLAVAKIKSVVIGNGSLLFYTKDDLTRSRELFRHNVLVASPRRPIDWALDVYGFLFGTIISLLMGILVDRDALVKLVKMPKPVAIGFVCQYIIMPLVSNII
jgi:hypothetical protein